MGHFRNKATLSANANAAPTVTELEAKNEELEAKLAKSEEDLEMWKFI